MMDGGWRQLPDILKKHWVCLKDEVVARILLLTLEFGSMYVANSVINSTVNTVHASHLPFCNHPVLYFWRFIFFKHTLSQCIFFTWLVDYKVSFLWTHKIKNKIYAVLGSFTTSLEINYILCSSLTLRHCGTYFPLLHCTTRGMW